MRPINFKELQVAQQKFDMRNHLEILSLHKMERLKHYGLHYAKYVGRLARGPQEEKGLGATLVDAFLISLSAANALNQRLYDESFSPQVNELSLMQFADAVGRFADACEKLDHLENFRDIALISNRDIVDWILRCAEANNIDLVFGVDKRRDVLSHRQAYHPEEI